MKRSYRDSSKRPLRWALFATALVGATTLLASAALAGPKGTIVVRPLGDQQVTIDGNIADWPLDKFTQVSEQPLFPEGQNKDQTTAMGDHIVFDRLRVGLFNGTLPEALQANANDFGSSVYFAYDAKFLYMLAVFIDDQIRDDLDTSDFGTAGYLNDGFEFFLDPKNDSKGCVANDAAADFDTHDAYVDDLQITVGVNSAFKPQGAAADVLGARQTVARTGNPDIIGPGSGQKGGIYQDALTAIGGPDIAAKKYDDLRASGAKNPEIIANPNVKYTGYVIEMRVPFDPKIAGFAPDHNMKFDLFWRDRDADDDTGAGGASVSWIDWAQSTAVTCNNGGDELKPALFNADNWAALVFDKTNYLGNPPKP
jgi:hypothetical protein